ncbi:putative magnesium transporter [Nymphaea thermarum]|nr:putative magnesium transporter [Nymphaea thermarum]
MTLLLRVGSVLNASNLKGFLLAVVSSAFIGSSFILKKKGLKRAGAYGERAGSGGYGYLLEPLWWVGMTSMIAGEIANFVAYIFAPAVLVTPLGALSIIVRQSCFTRINLQLNFDIRIDHVLMPTLATCDIVTACSAVLAHFMLNERLQKMGMLGCLLCIVGSIVIVLHAPSEHSLTSVLEIWSLATQPASAVVTSLVLMLHCGPRYGQTNIMVYLAICSLFGSLTVMSIKAVGIAIKLTVEGTNQAVYPETWIFAMVAVTCIVIQLNYLNMALDTFNAATVSPIYYAMFTILTIVASSIMFKIYMHHFLLQCPGMYICPMESLIS